MIRLKDALKEIFLAAMEPGGTLHKVCEAVLDTSQTKPPTDIDNFIVLGDFRATDVRTGDLKDKYRVFEINIECGAIVKNEVDSEAFAEEKSYEISRIIRTLLKANRKLISTSYPSGIAKSSSLMGDYIDYVIYVDALCCLSRIVLEVKIEEED